MLKLGSLSVYDAATDDSRANVEYFKWVITKYDEPEEHRSVFSLLSNLNVTKHGNTSCLLCRWHVCPGGVCCSKFAKLCEETIIHKTGMCTNVNTPAQ